MFVTRISDGNRFRKNVLTLINPIHIEGKKMSKKDVDEKLMDWNKIFEELTLDTKALIKDLLEGIN